MLRRGICARWRRRGNALRRCQLAGTEIARADIRVGASRCGLRGLTLGPQGLEAQHLHVEMQRTSFSSSEIRRLLLGPPLCERVSTRPASDHLLARFYQTTASHFRDTYGQEACSDVLSRLPAVGQDWQQLRDGYPEISRLAFVLLYIHMEPDIRRLVTGADEMRSRLIERTLPLCVQKYVDDFCQSPERMVGLTAHLWLSWGSDLKATDGVPSVFDTMQPIQHPKRQCVR